MTEPKKSTANREPTGRFPKGVSGNPSGRPAGSGVYPDWFRGQLTEDSQKYLAQLARGEATDEKITRGMACLEVLDRVIGKPKQSVSVGAARGLLAELLSGAPPPMPTDD